MRLKELVYFALVSCWIVMAHAQEPASGNQSKNSNNKDEQETAKSKPELCIRLFKKMFITRRKQHLQSVTSLREDHSYQKQYELISKMFEAMIGVFKERQKFIGDIEQMLSKNEKFVFANNEMRDDMATVLQNVALFADLVIQLPDISHRILKKHPVQKEKFFELLSFLNKTRFLIDDTTSSTIDLVFQELNITARLPEYSNPYSLENQQKEKEKEKERQKKKNNKKKRGPQMARADL